MTAHRPRRRALAALAGAMLAATCPAFAIDPAKRRVGILESHARGHPQGIASEFVAAMASLGYVEGRNVEYLHRHLGYDQEPGFDQRLAAVAEELVRGEPHVIMTSGTLCTTALARATRTIPIVTSIGNPLRGGFARSLARPGGNVTGVSLSSPETYEKTFDLLKAIIPGEWALAIAVDDGTGAVASLVDAVRAAAARRAIPVRMVDLRGMDAAQVDRALAGMRAQGIRVLSPFAMRTPGISDGAVFTTKYGLATVPTTDDIVARGGLLGYWPLNLETEERKALQVSRILRGTPAGEIPFETPQKFQLVVNRKAAALLGVTVPARILLQADIVHD